ncbi:MAG: DNA modification methylase [Phycisphaerales bacterium]|nr:DNA modification methylase [Phycisphaerales bacterium]
MNVSIANVLTSTNSDSPLVSIVSFPDRCPAWGDGSYRGNCDGRLLLQLVQHYQPRSVADPMLGSGTTRDVIRDLNRTSANPIQYWGSDLRLGFNLLMQDLPGVFDLVWIHPPYWDIIRYSKDPSDLSTFEIYEEFRAALRACLGRCFAALTPGGRLAILVGDIRRNGTYTPLIRDVLNLEGELGQLRSIIIKAQHKCRSDAKTYARIEDARIMHEYCIIFKKVREAEHARGGR